MKRRPQTILLLLLLTVKHSSAQTLSVLHNFTDKPDGASPLGLVMSGNTLYGTTRQGGIGDWASTGNGTVFCVNSDGTAYRLLHTFTARPPQLNSNSDGAIPFAGLLLSGGTLYGTTLGGGSYGYGTIFSVNPNGSFAVLYSFDGHPNGTSPSSTLVLSGGTLYGTTQYGGIYTNQYGGAAGTVFSLNTDGTRFTLLHSFTVPSSVSPYTNADGAGPYAGLVLSGDTLYGTTAMGGSGGRGTVFALKTNGTAFLVLHSFTPAPNYPFTNTDGASPHTTLTLSHGILYGTTMVGGTNGCGTVFALNTNGSCFRLLHQFDGTNGQHPSTPLTICGNTLYGGAGSAGLNDSGVVYSVNIDGTGFCVLQHTAFDGGSSGSPFGSLVLTSNQLYGSTAIGGASNRGTVFRVPLPSPPPVVVTQPRSLTVTNGDRAVFSVTASGSSPFTYQWRFDGSSILGSTNSSYTITSCVGDDSGDYDVVVYDYYARSVTSAVATLTVLVPPTITQQPQSQSVEVGSSALIGVTAGGTALYYHWFKDGTPISNGTQSLVRFESVTSRDAGEYMVVVSNVLGVATSSNALFAVRLRGAPIIRVDNQLVVNNVSNVLLATVTMESGYTNGVVMYTLDGSRPDFGSFIYSSPIVVSDTTVVRALGLNVDTFETSEAPIVMIEVYYPVTVATAGGGSVHVLPPEALHLSKSRISVSAIASSGWEFLGWEGDSGGESNPLILTVDAPKHVSAVFGTAVATYVIGSGVIVLNRTNPVAYGTAVHATAIPNSGSYFAQWGSALTGTNNPAVFTVTSTNPVRAVFGALQPGQVALTVQIVGSGSVVVAPRKQVYAANDYVTLRAAPVDPYNQFIGWTGDAVDTSNPLLLRLNTSKVLTAHFSLVAPALEVARHGGYVHLGWPIVYSNYTLMTTHALLGGSWATSTTAQAITASNISVTLPMTNIQEFYRLEAVQ